MWVIARISIPSTGIPQVERQSCKNCRTNSYPNSSPFLDPYHFRTSFSKIRPCLGRGEWPAPKQPLFAPAGCSPIGSFPRPIPASHYPNTTWLFRGRDRAARSTDTLLCMLSGRSFVNRSGSATQGRQRRTRLVFVRHRRHRRTDRDLVAGGHCTQLKRRTVGSSLAVLLYPPTLFPRAERLPAGASLLPTNGSLKRELTRASDLIGENRK